MSPSLSSIPEIGAEQVQVPLEARFTPADQFNEYVGGDYIPIGVYEDTDTGRWVVNGEAADIHSTKRFREEFPSKKSAVSFVTDEKLSLGGSHSFRVAVLYDEPRSVEDIIFADGFETHRVMQSRGGDGWVHGFRGDHDYNPGSGDKEGIIKGAKESVITGGYDKLIIEDENQDVEAVWLNCFLAQPDVPW